MRIENQNNSAAVCVGELSDAQLDQVAGGVIGVDDVIVIGAAVVVAGMAVTAAVAVGAWLVSLWW